MDDVMSVYRQDGMGMSAVLNKDQVRMVERLIDLLVRVKPLYGEAYAHSFDEAIDEYRKMRDVYAKEDFYEKHPIARVFRLKTHRRWIKKRLRKLL
jgi:hypothetical protein